MVHTEEIEKRSVVKRGGGSRRSSGEMAPRDLIIHSATTKFESNQTSTDHEIITEKKDHIRPKFIRKPSLFHERQLRKNCTAISRQGLFEMPLHFCETRRKAETTCGETLGLGLCFLERTRLHETLCRKVCLPPEHRIRCMHSRPTALIRCINSCHSSCQRLAG